ncbi:Gst Glutathione S-transferase [Rhabdaerophilaceae bacterium]
MILIGQFDSPFVRRVGIALELYGLPYEHRPWSSFGDSDKIRQYNPLTRVPTLVLEDGTALVDSHMIIDYLDGLMPSTARLFPPSEPMRHKALRIAAFATGLADKVVSLFYEMRLHEAPSEVWMARCKMQIVTALSILEQERITRGTGFWFSDVMGHADIALACVLRFLSDVHPDVIAASTCPLLLKDAAALEAMPVLQKISQPFIPPT